MDWPLYKQFLGMFKDYESQTFPNDATTTAIWSKVKEIVTPASYLKKLRLEVGHKINFFWT